MDEPELSLYNETVMIVEEADDTVCPICWAEFLDAEDLHTHTTQVHLTETRKQRFCELCKKIFPDLEKYMSHILYTHLAKLKCCRHCFRLFPDIVSRMYHEKKHKYRCKKEIYCSQCNECFNDKMYLEHHEYNVHSKCGEGIMINQGFALLSSMLNMNVRRFLTGYNEVITYVCACCQFTSPSMFAYIDHLRETPCTSYACDMCVNVYYKKKNLIKHFLSKHGRHNIVECPKCHVMYTRSALKVHEKTCSLLKCIECDLSFKSVNEITNHKIEVHKECAMVDRCKFCNKQVIGEAMMKKHIERSHGGTLHLYKYKCVYCDIIFKHPRQLFGHFYSTHKDILPYTCKICDVQFRIRKKFTIHVRFEHKGTGFLEFDENYHVSFADKRSENPFVPQSLYIEYGPQRFHKEKKDAVASKKGDEESDTVISIESDEGNKGGTVKRKIQKRRRKSPIYELDDFSSDDSDVPLNKIRKAHAPPPTPSGSPWNKTKNKKIVRAPNNFYCEQCKKNCYTLQNYNHHMNIHRGFVSKKCIKCNATFKNQRELDRHMDAEHSKSGLTETLKKVMERRKLQKDRVNKTKPHSKRFRVAMKKVVVDVHETPATLKEVTQSNKVSVKNFIENFVPDTSDNVRIKNCVTMGITSEARPPVIKMHKCSLDSDLNALTSKPKLKKPVQFTAVEETDQATLKLVSCQMKRANLNYGEKISSVKLNVLNMDHSYCEEVNDNVETEVQYQEYENTQDNGEHVQQQIPEVAEEVMLGSEEVKVPQTIIVHNVPKAYKSIRIGTVQPEAPYYKILKLDDILINPTEKSDDKKYVSLPDGTQLVSVNPLAHLIDKERIIKKTTPKKYYQPKEKDIGEAISKLLNKSRSKRGTNSRKKTL